MSYIGAESSQKTSREADKAVGCALRTMVHEMHPTKPFPILPL
jgi:hypothetical protein